MPALNSRLVKRPQTIHFLQILRGLAAFFVVCYHATLVMSNHYSIQSLNGFFYWGYSGVPLFFVISGFIILLIHFNDISHANRAVNYLYKRFARIYPVYWLMLLIYLPFFSFGSDTIHWPHILENITLLRISNHDKIISVAWTLSYEILFYLVFMILILNRVVGVIAIAIWAFLIAYNLIVGAILMPPYMLSTISGIDYGVYTNFVRLLSSPMNVLFALGGMSYIVYKAISVHPRHEHIAKYSLLAGMLIFIMASFYWLVLVGEGRDPNDVRSFYGIFGIATFFIILASASTKIEIWAEKQITLLLLGNASYSIYLIHLLMQKQIIKGFDLFAETQPILFFIILIVLPTCVGLIFYRFAEAPLLNHFRRRRSIHPSKLISAR